MLLWQSYINIILSFSLKLALFRDIYHILMSFIMLSTLQVIVACRPHLFYFVNSLELHGNAPYCYLQLHLHFLSCF